MSQNKKDFNREFQNLHEAHTPSEDEETIWLLSYADLMTLLFTFFVMLYSSVQLDEGKSLRNALSNYIQGTGGTAVGEGKGAGPGKGPGDGKGGPGTGPGVADGTGGNSGFGTIKDIKAALSARIEDERLLKDVQVAIRKDGLDITFSSNLLFGVGAAELRPETQMTIHKMIEVIKEKAPNMKIRIEGHTDDTPISKKSRFKSNWELSGARAAHIAALFEKYGFPSANLVAIGYADSRPVSPNRSPSGEVNIEAQRINRRVVLTIFQPSKVPAAQ